jgi:RNA polymerase sigma-70 factor (ECF subfamily)
MQSQIAITQKTTTQAAFATHATSDEALIERIAEGRKDAMQVLFARHNVRVFRFALRLVNDRSLAEDIVSDVFLEVWRKAGQFEARSQVSTWILAIARYKALTALRGRRFEELDEAKINTIEDGSETPEDLMHRAKTGEILRDCLQQLSPAHREIIDLVYYHETSIEDAGEILGIPRNTVKTRMFYARKHLAELVQKAGITQALAA